ncbi:MAG: hypothetical protein LBH37_01430 [Oscillospiraceae bacterium]|nr:hypothetical protein [Oscillospiraceae bacterium]
MKKIKRAAVAISFYIFIRRILTDLNALLTAIIFGIFIGFLIKNNKRSGS